MGGATLLLILSAKASGGGGGGGTTPTIIGRGGIVLFPSPSPVQVGGQRFVANTKQTDIK